MHKDIENKIGNLEAQKKQVKLEITELKEALIQRENLLNKVDGAIEFANSIIEVPKDDKKKKEKQDA